MKTTNIAISSLIVALGVVGVAGCGGGNEEKISLPATESADSNAAPVAVKLTTIRSEKVARPILATGTTEPVRDADLAPAMSARIDRIWITKGQMVKKNQRLVSLDAATAKLSASQAWASAAAADAQAQQAANDYSRLAPLAARGSIPKSRLDQLATQREAAQAQAKAARAAASSASRAAQNAELRAPFAGIIASLPIEVGEMASMGPGQSLVRLIDLSSVKVSIQVGEAAIAGLGIGDTVKVTIPSMGMTASGAISEIASELDAKTRTGEIIVMLANPNQEIRGGLFAELEIAPLATRSALLAPRSAVAGQSATTQYVLIVKDGVAVRQPVVTAQFDATRVEIVSGLEDGAEVIAEGISTIAAGTSVTTKAVAANAGEPAAKSDPNPNAEKKTSTQGAN